MGDTTDPGLAHALSLLDENELAAINEKDDDAAAAVAAAADPEGKDPDDDEDEDGANPDASAAPAAPAPAPAAAAPAPAPAPAADAAPAAPAAAAPAADDEDEPGLIVPLPEDFDAKVKANADAIAELRAKNRAGEISAEEYDERLDKLNDEKADLRAMRSDHDASVRAEQHRAQQQWQRTIRTAFNAAKGEGIDYAADEEKRNDLDGFVKMLGARPEHADKSMSWFLAEAHRRVLALHGLSGKTPAPAAAAPAPAAAKATAAAARKPPVDAVPQTLAHLPVTDNAATEVTDEFDELDKLDGEDYEEALARKPAAWREQYLRASSQRTRGNSRLQ